MTRSSSSSSSSSGRPGSVMSAERVMDGECLHLRRARAAPPLVCLFTAAAVVIE